MSVIRIVFIAVLVLLLSKCTTRFTCPPDKKIGTLPFTENAKSFIPYQDNQPLIFLNQTGDSWNLTVKKTESSMNNRLCTKEICTTLDVKSKTTCEYLGGEVQRFFISGQRNGKDFGGDLLFTHVQEKVYERQFTTIFRFSLDWNGIAMAGQMIENDFSADPDPNNLVSELGQLLEKKPEVTLNGITFKEVYSNEKIYPYFYFTKEKGLVGFKTATEIWVIQ